MVAENASLVRSVLTKLQDGTIVTASGSHTAFSSSTTGSAQTSSKPRSNIKKDSAVSSVATDERYVKMIRAFATKGSVERGRLIDAVDCMIMGTSPFIQEVPNVTLASSVYSSFDVTTGEFNSLLPKDLERFMHHRVFVAGNRRDLEAESLYSLMVGVFKDRRARVVRACKKAFSHVVDLMKVDIDSPSPSKKKSGGIYWSVSIAEI